MFARSTNVIGRAVIAAACSAGLVATVTGCGGASSLSAARLSVASPSGAGTRTEAPRRLTVAEARTAYERISAPFNDAVATVNQDAKTGTTWARFHADLLAAVSANRTWVRAVKEQRWPLRVQALIDAMLATEVPAEISCDEKMADAGSLQGAASVFGEDASCRDNPASADELRKILGLPATIG